MGSNQSGLDVEERGERGSTVVYGQIKVVSTRRAGVDTRLVHCGPKCAYSLRYVVLSSYGYLKNLASGNAIVGWVANAIGGNGNIVSRPIRRLRKIVGVGQQIPYKPCLTPSCQVGPIASSPDLAHIGVEQIIDRLRRLRSQTRRGHANQSANVSQSATVGDCSHLVFVFHPSTC